jgi:hypothetical protein
MHKMITVIVTAGSLAAAIITTPKPAEARCLGCWVGAGIAAGVIGGALASRAYGYGYAPYAYAQPYYGYSDGYGYSRGYGYSDGYGYSRAYGYSNGYYALRRYYSRGYYGY